jgi:hypothetical protein
MTQNDMRLRREWAMSQWYRIRGLLREGDTSSLPSEMFENILDVYEDVYEDDHVRRVTPDAARRRG